MNETVEIRFKSPDGSVHDLQVAELIAVDGKPFVGGEFQQQLDRIEYKLDQLCVVVE